MVKTLGRPVVGSPAISDAFLRIYLIAKKTNFVVIDQFIFRSVSVSKLAAETSRSRCKKISSRGEQRRDALDGRGAEMT
jgi:hypothetical protein